MRTILLGLALLLFASCSKDPINNLTSEESNVYTTHRDTTVNFRVYNTYSISDSMIVRRSDGITYSSTAQDQAFINAFRQNMQTRGFTQAARGANPDLGVQLSLIINTNVGIIALPDIWNGWNPGFWGPYDPTWGWGMGPGWGWGGGFATYQVTTALMSADIFDLRNAEANRTLRVIWNGVIQGDEVYEPSTANAQISQLFTQSPYLVAQ
jgi:hypothetical protein